MINMFVVLLSYEHITMKLNSGILETIFQTNGMLERLTFTKPSDINVIASVQKSGWANKEVNGINRYEIWPNTGLLGWQAHDLHSRRPKRLYKDGLTFTLKIRGFQLCKSKKRRILEAADEELMASCHSHVTHILTELNAIKLKQNESHIR